MVACFAGEQDDGLEDDFEGEDSSLLVSPEKPLNVDEEAVDAMREGESKHEFHPNPANHPSEEGSESRS